ncbi:MAG: efflux RND transporter periplasmic adaptor subunit, partial [Rhodospirillaceae bacterium]
LRALQDNGRMTKVALAEAVNLSPSPCWERLKKLESAGLITGYRAMIDIRKIAPVTEVMVEVGDRVAQSDILARLDTETLDLERSLAAAEVDADQASLEEAIARRILAEQELARLSQLRTSAAFSAARYEDQSQNVAAALSFERRAQADLARAQANLGLTETRLMDAVIRAPYPGVVTRRHTEIGAYVAAGSPVADLVNDLELEIEADVPTVLLPGLLPGTEILVDLPKIPKATVRAIVPNENPRTRTRVVRFTALDAEGNPLQRGALADVENPIATLALAANQSVSLQVPSGAPGAVLTVAKDAIVAGSRGTMVFVAKDGVAESRPVRIGRAIGDRFVVLDDLADGDIAVVRGNERLRPGQAVVPMINGQPVTPPAEDTPEPPAAAPPAAESSEDATQTEKS